MNPISRIRAPELAAEALRRELRAGRWTGRLPGTRVLAKHLGVSPPTVALALARLAAEGLLEQPGPRQAFRFTGRGRAKATGKGKRLLVLTHEEPARVTETSRRLLETLCRQMADKGWRVDMQVVDFLHVKHAQRTWDRIIQVDEETRVIALYGRPAIAYWAEKRGVRIFFLGGIRGEFDVPTVAVKSASMVETAVTRLVAMGHWKVVLPLCDRAEPFKASIREVMRQIIEGGGHHYVPSYHNPESDYLTPDVTRRMIESTFAIDPPTALVFLDWKELVTAQCVLSRLNLKVPADVSLVLLNNQMEAEWFHPPLSRFQFPERRLVRTMVRWLEDKATGPQLTLLPSKFIEGETMAPPAVKPGAPSAKVR